MRTSSATAGKAQGAYQPSKRPKWHYIYFLLAAFDLLTVSAGLYLNHRIVNIYTQSVAINRVWAERAEAYSQLGQLAASVNAPGNDVFDTRQVAAESQKMRSALEAFDRQLALIRKELEVTRTPAVPAHLLGQLDAIAIAMKQMTDEAELIFANFRSQRPDLAGERMATMDRKYASLNTTLTQLRAAVGAIQQQNFDRQTAAAANLQKYEYLIGMLILVMVGAATLYGHRIARQVQSDDEEKRHHLKALSEAETYTRCILDTAAEGIVAFDELRRIESFNQAAERLFGYSADEVLGRDVESLIPELSERLHTLPLHDSRNNSASPSRIPDCTSIGQRKDGTSFPVDLSVSEVRIGGKTVFTAIVRDISDRRNAEDALQLAGTAQAANRAKSAFLAAMSHELRTPMNGVVGMLDVLRETDLNPDQRDMLGTVRESAFSLLDIIDDVLDFSKIEAGKLELERVPVSIAKLVEGISETLAPMAYEKHVELIVFSDPRIPEWVCTDPVRLRQILFNLAGNAVKFTKTDGDKAGKVVVRADLLESTERGFRVRIQVVDNGIGMSEETLSKLFQPFTQGESSTTRHFGGTGLGLSISSRLAELMGGTIDVRGVLGAGSTFAVTFEFESVTGPSSTDRQFDLGDLRVVVLAAKDEMRDILTAYLSHSGAEVLPANDPDDALRNLQEANRRSPLCAIVVVDAPNDQERVTALKQMFQRAPETGTTHFVVIQRGRRHTGRVADSDTVSIDANAMRRSAFLRAVAVAAGRASPEQEVGEEIPASVPVLSAHVAEAMGRLILVVEDNLTNQKVIARQLSLLGYTAEITNNGQEALKSWRDKRFALVLCDCHMPEMDGFEFTMTLRKEEGDGLRIPVVAITANALKGEAERCFAVGMDDYLAKPIQLVALRKMMAKWLPRTTRPGQHASSPSAAPYSESAVNPDALKEITGDDPAMWAEFLGDFLHTAREAVAEIRQAHDLRLAGEVKAVAHKLKSSARTVGADGLADLCEELESLGGVVDWANIDVAMPRLEVCFAEVEGYIREYMCHAPSSLTSDAVSDSFAQS